MKIAIFYHCILSGGSVPIDTGSACHIMQEQMSALTRSGLIDAADEFYIGINGSEDDAKIARMFAPYKAKIVVHGTQTTTEIPTLNILRAWLPAHSDWYVLYHHIKGVTHPNEPAYAAWRRRMEKAVVWGWRDCVAQLDNGMDACGCHWLTPEQFPSLVHNCPFFGGTFWWSTAKYLSQLPPLPAATWANRFEAENWIGRRRPYPKVRDFLPGWP